jgi:A/G-specific adenine glycosylase
MYEESIKPDLKKYFTKTLMQWYNPKDRPMPWKGIKDPYKIWLSEIILQQTRVAQGLPYYNKLIKLFPTVIHLANAPEEKLMKAWQGLGYYSRARNLHASAKIITQDYNAIFPDNYIDIIKLKGIGEYTAAAIASFAYNEKHAVVDGNVYRVLSRFFGLEQSIDDSKSKKYFNTIANELIDHEEPGIYNQAIMDFGATICKPLGAECETCCLKKKCIAYNTSKVELLPTRTKKINIKKRYFNYLVINYNNQTLIQKREQEDIWKGLHQFPLIETKVKKNISNIKKSKSWKEFFNSYDYKIKKISQVQHQLTHQHLSIQFIEVIVNSEIKNFNLSNHYKIASFDKLIKFSVPIAIASFIKTLY